MALHKLIDETKVRIGGVRASYEHLLKASSFPGSDDQKFSMCALVGKDDKDAIAILEEAIKNAEKKGVEKYGDKFSKAKKHSPLHDGDVEKADQEGYENCIYFNCSNKQQPRVLDASTGMVAEEAAIYSGMYGTLIVNFYPYFNTAAACGVSASLMGFQKTADGEALGGSRVSDSDFDDDEGSLLD